MLAAGTDYSVVLTRGTSGVWRGTAVGRTQVWIQGAAPSIKPRIEWTLSENEGLQLDRILDDPCFYAEPTTLPIGGAPLIGAMGVHVDTITPTHARSYFSLDGDAEGLMQTLISLTMPPRR